MNNLDDRFIDGTFAHGDLDAIMGRIQAHIDAGASHVCIQPVNPSGVMVEPDMDALKAVAGAFDG